MPTYITALRNRFFDENTSLNEIGPFRGLYITRAADPALRAGSQPAAPYRPDNAFARRRLYRRPVDEKSNGGLSPKAFWQRPQRISCLPVHHFLIPATLRFDASKEAL
jgi:hypothetical protein